MHGRPRCTVLNSTLASASQWQSWAISAFTHFLFRQTLKTPTDVCASVHAFVDETSNESNQDALASFYTMNANRLGRRALEFYTQPSIYLFINSVLKKKKKKWRMDTCYFTLYNHAKDLSKKERKKGKINLCEKSCYGEKHASISFQLDITATPLCFSLVSFGSVLIIVQRTQVHSEGVEFRSKTLLPPCTLWTTALHWNKRVKRRYEKTSGRWTVQTTPRDGRSDCSSCRHVATARVALYFYCAAGPRGGAGGWQRKEEEQTLGHLHVK